MKRFYKFLLLLFVVLFFISFVYGTVISWVTFKMLQIKAGSGIWFQTKGFSPFLMIGLIQASLYSLVLLVAIAFLMKRSIDNNQKFTIGYIIRIMGWFFLLTTVVYLIHYISFPKGFSFSALYLVAGPQFALPGYLWLPFPLAWLTLFIILAAGIKKRD